MLFLASFPRLARILFRTWATVLGVSLLMFCAPAQASASTAEKETIISASSIHSDQTTGIVTATGKVEIAAAAISCMPKK